MSFDWSSETALVLGQGRNIFSLAKELSSRGAGVSFQFLTSLEQLYQLPLEHYTMVILDSGGSDQSFDVLDVGGILKRSNMDLTVFWASDQFKMSSVSDAATNAFCDVLLALPASPKHLELFLRRG